MLREPISDASFAASLCWCEPLLLRRAVINDHVCLFSAADGDLSMMLPPLPTRLSSDAELAGALEACFEIMDAANDRGPGVERSRIEYVSDEVLEHIRSIRALPLSASPMPGDYVYRRDALVELAGGDLKGKRKLRSKFLRENPDVQTADITPADIPECVELLSLWRHEADLRHEGEANDHLIGVDVLRERDERSTRRYLELIDELGLVSMTVRASGRLVGFTIGEQLTPAMGVVSVEKTHPDFAGAPQFIYSEFCRTRFEGATEINAGDDWGIDTLRYTKQSYRPSKMLSKSVLTRQPVHEPGGPEPSTVRLLSRGRPAPRHAEMIGGPTMSIRRATAEDAASMLDIESRAFADSDDRFTLRQIRRLIANPRARVAVAEHEGLVAGWCVALIRTHRRTKSGRVYSVAVDPAMTGVGLGRGMLNWMLDALEQEGIARVYLEVRATNVAAISLYTSAGFRAIKTLSRYYAGDVDGLRMLRVAPSGAPALTDGDLS